MGLTGGWRAARATPADFALATQWGTGVNPVHAVYAGQPRGVIKEPLGSTGPADVSPETVLGPTAWGFQAEDAQYYQGEDYGYLRYDHPNWGESIDGGRADRDGRIMAYGKYPQPEGWPAWGPHFDDNPVDGFPVGGPPGGAGVRAYSDGADAERSKLINVGTTGSTGGWMSKLHGGVNDPRTSDPRQYEIATGLVQTSRSMDNGRAQARGTDDARTPIANRLTGVKVKSYPKDINMGGGPGTPDLRPQDTDRIPKRPFTFRMGAFPPLEAHTWNEVTYFPPVQRTVPDSPGSLVTQQSTGLTSPPSYGYTSEDGSYY